MSANILTSEERLELSQIDLIRFFTISQEDLPSLDSRGKLLYRFDQAAHICLLRWLGLVACGDRPSAPISPFSSLPATRDRPPTSEYRYPIICWARDQDTRALLW